MKLGLPEILILIIVIFIIFGVSRMMSGGRSGKPESRVTYKNAEDLEEERIKRQRRSRMQVLGSIFVIIGLVILLSAFNMFKWIFMGYTWSAIIIIIGIAVLFLSRRQ
jgi:Sec-independent protein translocase protein TatA